jgi:DNA processing protein
MEIDLEEQLIDWVQLIRSENIGPVSFWALLKRYGSAAQALSKLATIPHQGGRKITLYPRLQAKAEIDAHTKRGWHILAGFHEDYPKLLCQIPDKPPILSIYGIPQILNKPGIAIVGARNASLPGRQLAERLAYDLSQAGFSIISGLARGIDKHAHQGALTGGTIAVVAGGVDVIYPSEHHQLYHDIPRHGGVVVSEMPLSMYPGANHFPRRNRIVAGLSLGIIVVEAAVKSGSLITAQYGLDYGRDIFAVPGSPIDPRCRGTNQLLRQGAYLVETVDDILRVVQMESMPYKGATYNEERVEKVISSDLVTDQKIASLQQCLLRDLTSVPVTLDLLMGQYQCSYTELSSALLNLELSGHIQRLAANKVYRIFDKS